MFWLLIGSPDFWMKFSHLAGIRGTFDFVTQRRYVQIVCQYSVRLMKLSIAHGYRFVSHRRSTLPQPANMQCCYRFQIIQDKSRKTVRLWAIYSYKQRERICNKLVLRWFCTRDLLEFCLIVFEAVFKPLSHIFNFSPLLWNRFEVLIPTCSKRYWEFQ